MCTNVSMKDPRAQPEARRHTLRDDMQNRGQLSLGDNNEAAMPRSSDYSIMRERLSGMISPPPMKRQRTGSYTSTPVSDRLGSADITSYGSSRSQIGSNASNVRLGHEENKGAPVSDYSRRSYSSLAPPANSRLQSLDRHAKSRRSDGAYPGPMSRKTSPSKRTCRVCEKSSATNYNPIITCPGCGRPYHDSCRKPPPVDGIDSLHWRCSKCLTSNRSRRSSGFLAPQAPKAVSVLPLAGKTDGKTDGSGHLEPEADTDQKAPLQRPQTSLSPYFSEGVNVSWGAPRRKPERCSKTKLDLANSVPLSVHIDHETSERLCGNFEATPVITGRAPVSSGQNTLPDLSDNTGLNGSIIDTTKTGKDTPILKQPDGCKLKRTEVPNTPTQRSSQLGITDSAPIEGIAHNTVASVDIDSPLTKPPQSEKTASSAFSCSICQKQCILAKNISDSVKCRNCRNRSLIVETGKLEIPETPTATPTLEGDVQSNPQAALSATVQPSTLWFQSGLVASKPKIVQKKVRDDETPCASYQSIDPATKLETIIDMFSAADLAEQVLVSTADHARSTYPTQGDTPRKGTPSAGGSVTRANCLRITVKETREIPVLPTSESGINTKRRQRSIASLDECNENPTTLHPATTDGKTLNPELMQSELVAPDLVRSLDTARSLSESRLPTDMRSESPIVPLPERYYTIREMAQIALVAANGAYLTISQIADWIASTFPHLRKGKGMWEKLLALKLSSEQEFRGQNVIGVHGKRKFWGFTDTKVRNHYESEYEAFRKRSNLATKMLKELTTTEIAKIANKPSRRHEQVLSRYMKANQNTPNRADDDLDMLMTVSTPFSTNRTFVSTTRGSDPLYMPFERPTPRQPRSVLTFNHNTKREANFHRVFLQNQKPSVETMHSAEKAQKIAKIKARPSRKDFFGSDHRLGHVRRYMRQDIHDESDGAWKPTCSDRGEIDKDFEMEDSEEIRSLREVFDLPSNAIPMNDGQTELAFRDGTLINGKLPRPRQIYKVGKLVGGELTVRTS